MQWLQDLNWPGARSVFDHLKGLDRATLLPPFKAVVDRARAERDVEWEWGLALLADARGDLRADCEPWTPFTD